jgi:hypothetical protein
LQAKQFVLWKSFWGQSSQLRIEIVWEWKTIEWTWILCKILLGESLQIPSWVSVLRIRENEKRRRKNSNSIQNCLWKIGGSLGICQSTRRPRETSFRQRIRWCVQKERQSNRNKQLIIWWRRSAPTISWYSQRSKLCRRAVCFGRFVNRIRILADLKESCAKISQTDGSRARGNFKRYPLRIIKICSTEQCLA